MGLHHAHPRPQFGALRRLLPPVAWRDRMPQHLHTVSLASPYSRATSRLRPFSARTARRTRVYSSTRYIPPGVSRSCPWTQRSCTHSSRSLRSIKRKSGGLVLLRRITPLTQRDAVYFLICPKFLTRHECALLSVDSRTCGMITQYRDSIATWY